MNEGVRWPPLANEGVAFEPPFRFCQKRMLIQIGLYSPMNEGVSKATPGQRGGPDPKK